MRYMYSTRYPVTFQGLTKWIPASLLDKQLLNCTFSDPLLACLPVISLLSPVSQISPLPLISSPFQKKKVYKPPFPPIKPLSPKYSSLINGRLYQSITTVKLRVDWSRMVYLPTRSSDLFLIPGCMTSSFLYLSISTLHSSLLWRIDTVVFSKLNKPPCLY